MKCCGQHTWLWGLHCGLFQLCGPILNGEGMGCVLDSTTKINTVQEDASQGFGGGQLYDGVRSMILGFLRYLIVLILGIIFMPLSTISLLTMDWVLSLGWCFGSRSKERACVHSWVSCSGWPAWAHSRIHYLCWVVLCACGVEPTGNGYSSVVLCSIPGREI